MISIRARYKRWQNFKEDLKQKNKTSFYLIDAIETILVALLLALILRQFVIQTSFVFSGSMEPTLLKGDRVFVNKLSYYFTTPKRGDIILFQSPYHDKKEFVKRLIGLPGEKIIIKKGIVYINGKELMLPGINVRRDFCYYGPITVPKDSYFALGDNRSNSADSRFWGFVPKNELIGNAVFIFWPISRMQLLH
ncbi:MAG: signal peptidase I [Candidatus Margulisiibacteriota bacterium]|jgi:signal peptidase I